MLKWQNCLDDENKNFNQPYNSMKDEKKPKINIKNHLKYYYMLWRDFNQFYLPYFNHVLVLFCILAKLMSPSNLRLVQSRVSTQIWTWSLVCPLLYTGRVAKLGQPWSGPRQISWGPVTHHNHEKTIVAVDWALRELMLAWAAACGSTRLTPLSMIIVEHESRA